MKKKWFTLCLGIVLLGCSMRVKAQAEELMQLALDIEKLAQFRQILSDLKKGYEIIFGGYNTIKNISEGNFKLHQVFLDGLLQVSPAVKKYKRVADIIDDQLQLVKEYKTALNRFKNGGWFNPGELDYISHVYDNLFNLSLKNLDDLLTVITSSKLRMSDDERLAAIDKIYLDMQDKLMFLRSFNGGTSILALQRAREQREVRTMKSINGLP